jgi:2-polyprenyl-3-methyl-5-hydroxy-6-metoxy-1,4-benzoquinol methylase
MDLLEGNLVNPIKHWYYKHKFRVIHDLIRDEISTAKLLVDVGAGSALFSLELTKSSPKLEVIAVDTGYEHSKVVDVENRITYLQAGQGINADIYLFNDVLEHVPNDVEMLSEYVSSAPIGSKFLITVPAFMSLWSGHDVFLKHFRRYKRQEINKVIELSGLVVIKSQYLYAPLFPVAWIVRKLPKSQRVTSQMKDHGKTINAAMLLFLRLDQLFSKVMPFGISIIVLGEKTKV